VLNQTKDERQIYWNGGDSVNRCYRFVIKQEANFNHRTLFGKSASILSLSSSETGTEIEEDLQLCNEWYLVQNHYHITPNIKSFYALPKSMAHTSHLIFIVSL
jgi:hypothetical protein